MSAAPPGGNPTSIRTGFTGYLACANATPALAASASPAIQQTPFISIPSGQAYSTSVPESFTTFIGRALRIGEGEVHRSTEIGMLSRHSALLRGDSREVA